MSTVNKVTLIGFLGDEVKLHNFDNGNSIGNFSLATNESYTNKEGQRVDNTEWHNVVVRNKTAENCNKYLSKGSKVYLEGKIKTRQYEVDGQKRYTTEIHAYDVKFMDSKNDSVSNQSYNQPPSQQSSDDDLPF